MKRLPQHSSLRRWLALIFAAVSLAFSSVQAAPLDGSLDTTYGTSGKNSVNLGGDDIAYGGALQADGKMLVVGGARPGSTEDFGVARFNADGTLDTSFGTAGKYTLDVTTGRTDRATGVGVQASGKIIVGGYTRTVGQSDNFALIRLNTDGTLDTSFGTSGIFTLDFNAFGDRAFCLKVLANDQILLAGWASDVNFNSDFAVIRVNADGTLDTSFGTSGKAVVNVGSVQDTAYGIATDSQGRIVLAGISASNSTYMYTLLRFSASGAIDTGFGTNGVVRSNFSGSTNDNFQGVAIQSDDKIVAVGYSTGPNAAAIARFTTTGALDTTFNTTGYRIVDVGSNSDQFAAVAIQADGRIVAGGTYVNGIATDSLIARFTTAGALDTAFGSSGIRTAALGDSNDSILAIGFQASGKIAVAGNTSAAVSAADFGVARFTNSATVSAPAITNATLTAGGTYGSAFTTYTITGSDTPTSYSATGLPSGLSVDTATGQITGTPTTSGTFSVTLGATNSGGTGTATLTITVAKRALLVLNYTAVSKVYDATTAATLDTTNAVTSAVVSGDTITLNKAEAVGTFISKSFGSAKSVSISGFTISGTRSEHYSLTQPAKTANITKRPVTVSGVTIANKTYNGNAAASLVTTAASLVDAVSNDNVALDFGSASASFADAQVGTARSVTISGIALTGSDASNYTLTQPSATGNIGAAELTVSGVVAASKTYNGNAQAALTTTAATLVGVVSGDVVSLVSTNAEGSFSSKTAGQNKLVTTAGFTLGGTHAGNYTLAQPTTTATIERAPLAITGVTAEDKVYDGGTTATLGTAGAALSGLIQGDNVSLVSSSASGTFATKVVGTAKVVTTSGFSLSGTDKANYELAQPSAAASITAKALTVSGAAAESKVYDGGTTASLSLGNAALVGANSSSDAVSLDTTQAVGAFADKVVGPAKTVTISGLALTGADAGNFTLTPPTATAAITAKPLTVSGATAGNKVYDGNTTATLTLTSATLAGVIGNDAVTLDSTGALGAFASKTAAPGKTVTISGLVLTGADAGNYSLTAPTATATITTAPATVTGLVVKDKTYNGNTTGALNGPSATLNGIVNNDTVSLDVAGISITFDTKNIGTGKIATIAGLALTGVDAANYSLTQPTATAAITAKGLTVSGLTAENKTYDGTLTATASTTNASLDGVVDGENVTLNNSASTAQFATKTVGTAKTVTVSGLALGGTDAGNYTLTQPTATAAITAKSLTVSGVTVGNKAYDGTKAAIVTTTGAALGGVVTNDSVSLDAASVAGEFVDQHLGTGKAVTISGLALSGGDALNYSLTQPGATADITAATATVALGSLNQGYDRAPKAATATTTPANLPVAFAYNGVPLAFAGTDLSSFVGAIGRTVAVRVTGSLQGTAFGPGPYSINSNVAVAAVHAGVLTAGQTKILLVEIVEGDSYYCGMVSHGVSTSSANAAPASFRFAGEATTPHLTAAPVDVASYAVTVTVLDRNYTGTASGTLKITAAPLTVANVASPGKTYDGTTGATLDTTAATLVGVYDGDTVSLVAGNATAAFASKTIGSAKTVTVSGLTLSGASAANYSLTQPTATSVILAKSVTVSGVTAASRAYDATTVAALSAGSAVLDGIVANDNVVLDASAATGAFASKTIGAGKTVTVAGLALAGTDAGNYLLTQPTTTASITTRALTVSGVTASGKTYDGALTAAPSASGAALVGVAGNDVVTLDSSAISGAFATKAAGQGKTVAISGLALGGADAANYSLTAPTATATIAPKGVTVGGVTANSKVYDGTAAATPKFLNAELSGLVPNDTVTLVTDSASAAFATKAIGTAKTVTLAGLALGGADAANYTLTQPTTTADVTAKPLTVTGVTAVDRIYDATTVAALSTTGAMLAGAVQGDDVVLVTGQAAGAFATKTVGTAKDVTVSGLTLSGADAANYTLTQPTASASIAAKGLTVIGVTAANKAYDGTTVATLAFGSAQLVGIIANDTVTLVSSGAVGAFASAGAGAAQVVTVTGLALGGADAANYTLTAPALAADISKGAATIAFAGLSQSYSGGPRTVTATTTPSGLTTAITYGGLTTVPSNAGTYAIAATITDVNYEGSGTATLIVAKAQQSVSFPAPGSVRIGVGISLTATASSGLPVSFQVVSGNASLSGATLTLNDGGASVVRATQAGDANHVAASAEQTIASAAKLAQTIDFAALANRRSNEGTIALAATASSGLPVSFTVLSGPAIISGSSLTLTGAAGGVVVRASQAGNAAYDAAPEVTQSFNVIGASEHQVFFGITQNNDTVAIDLAPDGSSGTLLCYLGATGEAFIVSFTMNPDGTFDATVISLSAEDDASSSIAGRPVARAVSPRTFRGRLSGGMFSGSIVELGLNFTAAVQSPSGPTASIAGLYRSSALNSAAGTTTSIVGTQGQVLVIATTATMSTGGTGTVTANGNFSVRTPDAMIRGEVDDPTSTVSGSIMVPNQTPVDFSGVATTTLRTDRLVNLSSRARIGPAGGTLITGFVIGGTEAKRVLLRAIGPALTDFGVSGALSNPRLQLYNGRGELVLENDDWSGGDTASSSAQVGAFTLTAGGRDAALLTTLAPGAYTMVVMDGGETGIALAEIYDASANPRGEYQRLVNISSRGTVAAGDGVLIGGFVVTGNAPKKVLVRGTGPALAAFGVTGVLGNPQLSIYRGDTLVAQNDDWATPQRLNATQSMASAAEIEAAGRSTGAFSLTTGSKDAAIVITLAPGAYTAQVASADGATGVALVEVYELPE